MPRHIATRFAGILAVAVAAAMTVAGPAPASAPAKDNTFRITGSVDGLYPGANATVDARVTNPQPFTIQVTSVATTVHDANPSCPGALLEIGGVRAPVDVPAGATATVPLSVHMNGAAPDGCQGTAFGLDFVATAVATDAPVNPSSSGGLAFTGVDLAKVLATALSLVGLGLLARRANRRRRGRVR